MRSLKKSDFARLVIYITDTQNKTERLGPAQMTNCEASSLQDGMMEVLATQHLNTRAKGDKTYHLLVSFPTEENVEDGVLKDIEERLCVGLGYGEHQRISAVHHDTDHLHIHIAINKIHPTRYTMHEPFQSYRKLAELCTILEEEYGLRHDNHTFKRRISENRVLDMEKHSGIESLVGWIKRTCLHELLNAPSWGDFQGVLRNNGLRVGERANGFVIKAEGGPVVKASTVARALSKKNLEKRLGPFEAFLEGKEPTQGHGRGETQYQKNPVPLPVNTAALYTQYKAEQQTLRMNQPLALKKLRQGKEREIKAAKRVHRLRRATIKLIGEGRFNKKLLYGQASRALLSALQRIHTTYQKERQSFYKEHKRCTWADWLQKKAIENNSEALTALRARRAQGLKGNTLRGEGQTQGGPAPVIDTITKKGTIIFRVGLSAVRDDGERLQVSREATPEGLQAALRLARERYGNRIIVNGTPLFKAQILRAAVESQPPITFTDPVLERRRQDLLTKETPYERFTHPRERAGRGPCLVGSSSLPARANSSADDAGSLLTQKPHLKSYRPLPPPQSRHGLRTLSQCDVVCLSSRGDMLLPRDVSHHVEQQGANPDHPLRWSKGPRINQQQRVGANPSRAKRKEAPFKDIDTQKTLLSLGSSWDSVSNPLKGSIKPSRRRP